ncbi:MAG: N-formylglutamate amidohydrolase [bacterium]|nr:N-formylglutamate amidohydrolase [bacterium]
MSATRPFFTIAARNTGPLLLTCEHATNRLPFRAGLSAAERETMKTHWGWDIGAWDLTRDVARRMKAGAIGARWARLLVDPNRRVDDATLVRRRAGGVELSFNRGLTPAEIERRVLRYHTPYHVEVDRLILRRVVRGVRPLLLAMHTFTPDYHGQQRKFDVGVLYEHHRGLAHRMGRALRDRGLTVHYNQPYSGMAGMMYSVDRHGKHHGLPCLELEVNQKLFARKADLPRLGRAVVAAIEAVLPRLDPC